MDPVSLITAGAIDNFAGGLATSDAVRLQRRSIQETLDDVTQRGVVILGDPGSGKTTLLHYQALRATRAGLSSSKAAVLPIFVPLAAYDDYLGRTPQKPSLEHFLAVYYDQWHSLPGLAPLFERALESGDAVILLDGLDEVLDTGTRQFVAEQAGALIRQWASRGNRFAVTSRIVGYREARLPALPGFSKKTRMRRFVMQPMERCSDLQPHQRKR